MSDMMTQEEAINISNEQAVQILLPMRNMMCDQHGCPISDAVFALDKAIEVLSADRPQGMWIGEADGYADGEFVYDTWYCSNCDYAVDDDEPPTWNYCPNCGADMQKGADDE